MPLTLSQFVAKYPPTPPRKAPEAEDQLRALTPDGGVVVLTDAPFPEPVAGMPGFREGRHIWVIVPQSLPVILETAPKVRPPPLSSGVAKHTNLTGGQPACCGGELWIDALDADLLYVNGGSGRYGPRTPAHLAEAVQVFESLGFRVQSAGWNEDVDAPERVFRRP